MEVVLPRGGRRYLREKKFRVKSWLMGRVTVLRLSVWGVGREGRCGG